MIHRFLSFRWRIAVILVITVFVLYATKRSSEEGSNIFPHILSNAFFNALIQHDGQQRHVLDTSVILVSGPFMNGSDSAVGALVQKIALYKPGVIAVDYDLSDASLLHHFPVNDSVKIVLAAVIDEEDSIWYPVNIFNGDVHYGHVMSSLKNDMIPVRHEILTLAEQTVRLYDPGVFQNYLKREGRGGELINYLGPPSTFFVSSEHVMSGLFVDHLFLNKIVIIGKTGYRDEIPVPGFLDNVDVHQTPVGEQFGVVILYNQIHTLLGNFVDRSSRTLDYMMMACIASTSIFLSLGASGMKTQWLYVFTRVYVIAGIVGLAIFGIYLYHSYEIFIDYSAYCIALIASTEAGFWFSLGRPASAIQSK
ncbi:MAG TPA: CHASE2 domain-containing protein [Ohtaekwangia sp.]|nr:CHASE2 domain-containing protein [Ohtaekwangia sp.]